MAERPRVVDAVDEVLGYLTDLGERPASLPLTRDERRALLLEAGAGWPEVGPPTLWISYVVGAHDPIGRQVLYYKSVAITDAARG